MVGAISLALGEERFGTEDPARLRALARRIAGEIPDGIMRSDAVRR